MDCKRRPHGIRTEADFRPPWWMRSPHVQTLWPALLRRRSSLVLHRERLELPDGDFLDIDSTGQTEAPVVLVLHGLEGSSDSGYARGLLHAAYARGWCAMVMHFRGCSGEHNRLDRSYHSGETADIDHVVRHLRRRLQDRPLALVGYSLGGNALLKWLGEQGRSSSIQAAVAVSVPYLLSEAAERMRNGFSRIYQWRLLSSLRRKFMDKYGDGRPCPLDLGEVERSLDFWQFDDVVTAKLHGFADANDYYARCSSRQYLARIEVPTLLLHAIDDPFMSPAVIPQAEELAACTRLEVCKWGGHVGFVDPTQPRGSTYWLETRIPEFLAAYLGR